MPALLDAATSSVYTFALTAKLTYLIPYQEILLLAHFLGN